MKKEKSVEVKEIDCQHCQTPMKKTKKVKQSMALQLLDRKGDGFISQSLQLPRVKGVGVKLSADFNRQEEVHWAQGGDVVNFLTLFQTSPVPARSLSSPRSGVDNEEFIGLPGVTAGW